MEEYRRRASFLKAPLGGQASWSWDEIVSAFFYFYFFFFFVLLLLLTKTKKKH